VVSSWVPQKRTDSELHQ